ncbi:MAG TPA: tetratricopeptide repeat protein [Ktedonobacteraceae bacterium]|nr:tetratricopeptide repeat protein [Ktedonobacteraceae bacterium]
MSNQEPISYLTRALAIREKVFGFDHPYTKRTREDYTNLLQKMGQKTEGVDQQN